MSNNYDTLHDSEISETVRANMLLVRNKVTMPGIKKTRRDVAKDVHTQYNADDDAGTYIADLINPKMPLWRRVDTQKGLIRNLFIASTAPWGDDLYRCIAAKQYGALKSMMEEEYAAFMQYAEEVVSHYDSQILPEAKKRRGKMFDANEYPTAEQLRAKFSAELETMVLPNRFDIRLNLTETRSKLIIDEVTQHERDRIKGVAEHTLKVASEELNKMIDALDRTGTKKKGGERAQSFRDTLVPRMERIANLLPALNITGNEELNKIAREIKDKLCDATSEELRKDETLREKVKDDAEEMLDKINDVFNDQSDAA